MPEELIQTRIIPPGLTGSIVHRKRLLRLLSDNNDKALILICSSAGFGKTTLIQDFLSDKKYKYAWYYATADITNPYTFLTYIIFSLKQLSQNFGDRSLRIIDAIKKDTTLSKNYKNSINDISATFLNEFLTCFKDDIMLVIDDLHNINLKECGEWLNYLFDVLLDNLPRNLHLIITSREMPGFNTSKLKAKRRILHLDTKDLVFNENEIIELLEKIYSIDYTQDDLNILEKNISGWITGIHLILQAYGKDFRNVKLGDRLNYEDIFNYFANDIFGNLSEQTKDFLLETAFLDNFNSKMCARILNIENSEYIINELLSKNIFIQLANVSDAKPGGTAYGYQELFKLFLLAKVKELRTEEQINFLFKKLFNYYLSLNEFISAIDFGLKAKDYSSVIPLIIQNFMSLFDKGNYEILNVWLDSLPPEFLNSNAYLRYFSGLLQLYYRAEPEKAISYFSDASKLADNDVSLTVDCLIPKAEAMLLTGKVEELKKELDCALILNITRQQKARLLYAASTVSFREGHAKYNEMVELLTEALDICNEENLQTLKADVFRMLGNVYSGWGNQVKSINYLELALNMDTDVYRVFRIMYNLVISFCSLGNYVKAKEYLDRQIEMHNSFPSLLFKRSLLRSMGGFRFDCGDFEECIKNYEEANKLEIKHNIKHYAAYGYIMIGESHYYLKNYDSALQHFEIALNYIAENDEIHRFLDLYLKTKLSIKIKPVKDTEKVLLKMLDFTEKNNISFQKTQVEFNLADYYLRSGMTDTALKYLKDCLSVSSEKQFITFLEAEVLNSRSVFDFAFSRPELSEYKRFTKTLFENVREKLDYDWLSDECRRRLTRQVKELDDITTTSFGRLEFRLRGELIPESLWVRKKAKLILAYMLVKPNRQLTKDELIDRFFQDISLDNIDTIFHNTLSCLRNALKVKYDFDKSVKWSPVFLPYEAGILSWNTNFTYKADNIEFEKLYNSAKSASVKPNEKINVCKQAIELYQGDFLPGYYDTWCEEMRLDYSSMFIKLCTELIAALKEKELYSEVIKYAARLLKADKLSDEAHIGLIEAYSKLGETKAAKSQYFLMLKLYEEELGEKPKKSILDRINQILSLY